MLKRFIPAKTEDTNGIHCDGNSSNSNWADRRNGTEFALGVDTLDAKAARFFTRLFKKNQTMGNLKSS
jgi:hypothetical protein